MRFSIIGGGAWGATLAQVLLDNDHDVLIYERNPQHLEQLKMFQHPFFHVTLPHRLQVTDHLSVLLEYSDTIILAVPTKHYASLLKEIDSIHKAPKLWINVSKGFVLPNMMTMSQYMHQYYPHMMTYYVSLTGPSHAEEVIERNLTALVVSGPDDHKNQQIAEAFNNRYMRLYTSTDLIGAEVAGATKNAMAVASGMITSLEFGENARAALLTKGLQEMQRIVVAMQGQAFTTLSLTGVGDLIVTALSMQSRNFKAGLKIGQGMSREDIELLEKQTIEGFLTIEALYHIGNRHQLHLPIINTCYEIIFNKANFNDFIEKIRNHHVKNEQNSD
jgi:glycerol-3-phosphate dehydrogenase (NAD(P)+)